MHQKKPTDTNFKTSEKLGIENSPLSSSLDFSSLLEWQRKNFQALLEANQEIFQGWQSLARRQTEMTAQFFQDNTGISTDTNIPPSTQTAGSGTKAIFSACEKSMANARELAGMVQTCAAETSSLLNRRAMVCLAEIRAVSTMTAFEAKSPEDDKDKS